MQVGIVLTAAALTLLTLALPQSNESQKKPREANEYDYNARMGMYFAVMCESSSANDKQSKPGSMLRTR